MKFSSAIATLCVILGAVAVANAAPADAVRKPNPDYKKCIKEHGTGQWPYPGEGECHDIGYCECKPDGSIICVC
ncbi:hypothetical protein FBU59_004062 [Linderina macrospora]|uniref:Uncharacterized protein n=1 Tax=Linderina macrospora TaxID=4868 RepID=A0ACC1J6K9_9FUNG|nr:hypothetical protein FBU59_004062 [Linderina macrospora]